MKTIPANATFCKNCKYSQRDVYQETCLAGLTYELDHNGEARVKNHIDCSSKNSKLQCPDYELGRPQGFVLPKIQLKWSATTVAVSILAILAIIF